MRCIVVALLVMLVATSPMAWGAVSDADFAALRAELAAVSQRLDELAAENAQLKQRAGQAAVVAQQASDKVAAVEAASGDSAWSDRIGIKGDFRYRYENIDKDGSEERNRSRIRARAAIIADLPNDVEVGLGMASGGDDPVSSNQTLGGGGSTKGLNLDLAYFDWTALEGLHVIGGKFSNFLVRPAKHGLLWDGDWRPEGLGVTYQRGWFFANALGTWLESDSSKANDEFSWGGQLGIATEFGPVDVKLGGGYFDIKTQGKGAFFGDTTDPGDFFGNTAVGAGCGTGGTCVYAFNYELVEVFGEAGFSIGGVPANLYFDFVNNGDPSQNDTGYAAGIKLGKVKDSGDFEGSWTYQDLEADAVLGLLTDSDFGGGGTDSKGHVLKAGYGVNETWKLALTYFINEVDVSSGSKTDYNRLQLDTAWKYK